MGYSKCEEDNRLNNEDRRYLANSAGEDFDDGYVLMSARKRLYQREAERRGRLYEYRAY